MWIKQWKNLNLHNQLTMKISRLFKRMSTLIDFNKKPKGLILRPIYELSDKVIKYGSDMQLASREKYYLSSSTWMELTRAVAERLHEPAITYHRANLCLAQNGWSQNSVPLIRAIIESMINYAVITEEDCEFRSFKYLVFELLRLDSTPEERERSKKELKEQMFHYLDENNKIRAEEYLNKKTHGLYWYDGIYKGPRDVLRKTAPSLLDAYDLGGSASHGGQIGYKFFDEDPKLKDINPRKDPYSANLSIVFSIRYLLEFCLIRDRFEKLGLEDYYDKYVKDLVGLRALVENTKSHRAFFK